MGLPAHTPVPEYIRLIGQGRYDDAYMVNWVSNVFPGVLGRTCDRPCMSSPVGAAGWRNATAPSPNPVAICRLKRVAADHKSRGIKARMPAIYRAQRQARGLRGAAPHR